MKGLIYSVPSFYLFQYSGHNIMDKNAKIHKFITKPNLNGNRKKPKKLSFEDKKRNYEDYLVFKSSYPKGQLCNFYLRGSCWLDKEVCQFAHGISDLNTENYLKFSEDHFNKLIKNKEYAMNIQKYYMIVSFRSKDYKPLYDFQVELKNKGIIKFFYSLEVINQDSRKRTEIRRILHRMIFDEFCEFFFQKLFKNELITISKFEDYFESLGFLYNFRKFSSLKLLTKTVIDKKTKVKKSIIKLMPPPEEMMKSFEEVVLVKLTADLNSKSYDMIIPFTFQYISTIINKNIDFDKPLVHHYCKVKGISASEFLDEFINRTGFLSGFEKILNLMNLPIPQKDKIVHIYNQDEILLEFKENFWEKYTSITNSKFGFMNFDFIRDNYVQKFISEKRLGFVENSLVLKMKKLINQDKNLFFINNNNSMYLFNLNKFELFDLEELEENYEKRCDIISLDIQKIIEQIVEENDNDIVKTLKLYTEFQNEFELVNEEEIIALYDTKEIIIVDDISSLYYLLLKAQGFNVVSIDLEGSLTKRAEIELIQLNDNIQTFIIDYYTISVLKKNKIIEKIVKILMTFILENQKIQKIFHDGRMDSLALHSVFQACTSNYLDMSNLYSAIKQFNFQINFINKNIDITEGKIENDYINMLSFVGNSNNPGLNKVLEEFDPNHRINHLKEKIHKMFGNIEYRKEFFLKRPMEEEWIIYCDLDVKYLIDTLDNMLEQLKHIFKKFYGKQLKYDELLIVGRLLSNGHLKYSCESMK